jgi:hypothetical protein
MAAKGGKKGSSKVKKAPPEMAEMIETLLKMASSAPTYTLVGQATEAKLYEIVVLAEILGAYPGTVRVVSPGGAHIFRLAGAPSKATKATYTHFELIDASGRIEHEVWLSVEMKTLSWAYSGATSAGLATQHEIDVGVFSAPLPPTSYPTFDQLHAGLSCKHMGAAKVHVRELLGMRRETALLDDQQPAQAPWLGIAHVPAKPPSTMHLVSSSPAVIEYEDPITALGAYCAYVPFP